MGCPKPVLEWHGSTLVRRVAGIVARAVDGPVVLVRSRNQSLPPLPEVFAVLDDEDEGRGPLAGLSAGLAALQGCCEIAYVSSTDVPFLHPAFVRRVVAGLGDEVDACVPFVRGLRQPLSAAYRVGLAPLVRRLLDSDRLRVSALLEACRSGELDETALLADKDLARFDPGLQSVTNLNDPGEYREAALRPPPTVRVEWPGERASPRRRQPVRRPCPSRSSPAGQGPGGNARGRHRGSRRGARIKSHRPVERGPDTPRPRGTPRRGRRGLVCPGGHSPMTTVSEARELCGRAVHVAACGAAGIAEVLVRRKPVVAVPPTGDEKRPIGSDLAKGQFYDTNSLMLAALAEETGCDTIVLPIQPDDSRARNRHGLPNSLCEVRWRDRAAERRLGARGQRPRRSLYSMIWAVLPCGSPRGYATSQTASSGPMASGSARYTSRQDRRLPGRAATSDEQATAS